MSLENWVLFYFLLVCSFAQTAFGSSNELVLGKNFKVPVEQDIHFVSLEKINLDLFSGFPRKIDLRDIQSEVKSQGARGACTYFVITSLIESLIKKSTGTETDLSEEYLAWAAKTKKKLRSYEEDSSVAVNAVTVQEFGFMFEKDLPYQQSWFDKGFPCETKKGKKDVDLVCYAHAGPKPESERNIISGSTIEFRDIGSRSIDIVRELSSWKTPVTISILAHPNMWKETEKTGDLFLDKASKRECQLKPQVCTGHAALIVGYDIDKRIFYIKNSWGKVWGQQGYGTIPFDYIDQMSNRRLLIGRLLAAIKLPTEK
ncbi:C1 family peptidase [Bdellovibrio sp. HCB337]|uniref:C1 family peptidase n=1 Tax=Bdellovibrio sp. HCB337 TaxID=3394358 RepID=UPI0039A4CF24